MLTTVQRQAERRKNGDQTGVFAKEINKVTQILTSQSHIAIQLLSLG